MGVFFAIIVVIGLAALWWLVRKYFREWMSQGQDVSEGGFTLADLRQLHRSGQMSDEEFERAKAQIVLAHTAAAQKSAQKSTKPENNAASASMRRRPPA